MTAIGDDEFPRAYGELTTDLLGFLDDEQPEMLDRLFERRRDQRLERRERLRCRRFVRSRTKVAELTRILDEDGYFASWEDPIVDERQVRPAGSASSRTTAPSGRSRSDSARPARVRSSSSGPRSAMA